MGPVVRIATVALNGRDFDTLDRKLDYGLELIDLAAALNPDIVCLPETFATFHLDGPPGRWAQPLDGPIVTAVAERARRHGFAVVCPLLLGEDDRVYNAAVLIDRTGSVAGVYRKVHLVASEPDYSLLESGLTPGAEYRALDGGFGPVGIQICFDLEFAEGWNELGRAGVPVVFWPSAYDGGLPLTWYAYHNSYYVVASVRTRHSRIVDPLGREIAAANRWDQVAVSEVSTDFVVCHTDYHRDLWYEITGRYGGRVRCEVLGEENRLLVESRDAALPVSEVAREFGLDPVRDYIDRHEPALDEMRERGSVSPRETPFAARAK